MKLRSAVVLLLGAIVVVESTSSAQQKRAVTPRDCVTVRDLLHDDSSGRSTIKISPDGSRVAYLVKSPNLGTNENEVELYVRNLPADAADTGKSVLVGDISAPQWLADGKHLTILRKENGRRRLEQVDAVTGDLEVLIMAETDIAEYSINQSGNTVAYATDVPRQDPKSGPTVQEIASGYRIPFESPAGENSWASRKVLVTQRIQGTWTTPEPVTIRSPLSEQPARLAHSSGNQGLDLTLSIDGKQLLLSYLDFSETMPDEWRNSGFMQLRNSTGVIQAFHLLVLYDLATGETTVPIKTSWAVSAPLWSLDSKSFVVVAKAPVGSDMEKQDVKSHRIDGFSGAHLFWVQPSSGKVQQIASHVAYPPEGPLYWDKNGDVLVRVSGLNTITHLSRQEGEWKEESSFQVPLQLNDQVATDGQHVIGNFNDTRTPPELFVYQPGQKEVQVFAKLNPLLQNLTLAQVQEVHWKTSTGFDASGLLLLPPDYIKGGRYPLVIQTKPFGSFFVCSFGNFPSFAPQPLASAGIMYLGPIATKDSTQQEEDYFPEGYPGYRGPGGVAEAAFEMDLWDSAVRALDAQGLVDSSRVGIIGFSRTGWHTEFILAHSKIHYRAATVADNVQYSVGEYWLSHDASTMKTYDLTYSGPPYGATLKNWLDYSISFNIDKIHTPLLMEEMGYGIPYTNINAPPIGLAASFEVFTGLHRQSRPVELFYYPNEGHTPDHPQARLATLQRNLDWYRFWLQGYERPNPEDPGQYVRWRRLQDLQQEDDRRSGPRLTMSGSGPGQKKQ